MRRGVLLVALMLVACSGSSSTGDGRLDGPVGFRVLTEQENVTPCVEAPEFAVAPNEDRWVDIFDQQTSCGRQDEIDLPSVDFQTEVGVAMWWKRVGCLGFTIKTESIERTGNVVEVRARSTGPSGVCATAIGQLESFLAVQRAERFDGTQPMRFVLDGTVLGTVTPRATGT